LSNKNKQKKFIASVCPSIVAIVKTQFPEMKKFLLPFDSPMVATAKVLRKQNPNYKIIFLAPCNAKKIEAKESGIIDGVVNFTEMKEIIQNEQPCAINSTEKSHLFDRFYNDFTKIYPLGGGLSATLHSKDILKKNEIICCDNCKLVSIKKIFNKYMGKNEKKFFDLLFCPGGCIGGPGVESKSSIARRRKKILDYRSFANKEKIGKRKGLTKYTKGISFRKKFD
jgi:iron only hydrogenase large subunit-like protein